jgi:GNAT superfamily N-acetyltransferase
MSIWTEADDLLDEQPAAPAGSSSVWDEADALLGAKPAAATPSNVWADADALLSSAPAKPRPAVGPVEQRPTPFAAGGVTDETSVRVNGVPTWGALRTQMGQQPRGTVGDATLDDALRRGASDDELETISRNQARMQPPAFTLPKPSPDALIKSIRAKTMTGVDRSGMPIYGDPAPMGTVPVLDAPVVGVPRVIRGARQIIPATAGGTGRTSADVLHGANEALEGAMQTAMPAVAAGAIVDLPGTAYGLVRAWLAQQVGEKAADAVGADPEVSRLVGNVGAALSGTLSAADVAKATLERAQSAGRILTLASKLSSSGFGPGDVPGGRGVPYADEFSARGSDAVDARGAADHGFTEGTKAAIDEVLAERPEGVSQNVSRETTHPSPDLVPPGEEGLYNDERRVRDAGPPAGVAERRLAPSEAVRAAYKADPEGERTAAEDARRRADQFRAEQAEGRGEAPPAIDPAVVADIDQVLASKPGEKPAEPPAAGASVPFMMTRAMEAELRARGYDDAAIGKLTPADAHAILSQPATTPATAPQLALRVGDSREVQAVDSFEHAARLVRELVDRHEQATGEGASSFPSTHVIDTRTGAPVARISYNGRVWDMAGKEIAPAVEPSAPRPRISEQLGTLPERAAANGRVQQFSADLRAEFPAVRKLALAINPDDTLYLEDLQIDPSQRRQGIGSAVVRRINEFANAHGLTVSLTPARKFYGGPDGTTSADDLRTFYRRLGFVDNRGASRDTAIDAKMYRRPAAAEGKGETSPITDPAGAWTMRPETKAAVDELLAEKQSARQAQLERLATDDAMGVEFPEGQASHFPNGEDAVVCTNCARRIIELNGGHGEIYGWHEGDNPTAVVANTSHENAGHDFAVIDGRYLVDAWAKNVEESSPRAVFDLENPDDVREVRHLFGDPTTWVRAAAPMAADDLKFAPGYPKQLAPSDTGKGRDEAAEAPAGDRKTHGDDERLSPENGGPVSSEGGAPGAQAAPAETAKERAKRERAERRARRKQDRDDYRAAVAEDERTLINDAIDRAVAEGYTGDRETLHAVILDRVKIIRELDADYRESDRNPRRLLEEIARLGGISIKAEAGTAEGLRAGRGEQGEIRHLQSFGKMNATKTAGALGGVSGVFSEGPRGLSLDRIVEGLTQNREFRYITSIKDLFEELYGAARLDAPAADDYAVARAISMLESSGYWWAESPVVDETPAHPADAAGAETEPDDFADVEFDPRDFEAEGLDVLETGEVQPHLPGAGSVRAEEKATPEVADAPFSLESEAAETAGVEGDLFAGTHARPTFGSKKGMAAPEGPRRWDAGEKKPAPPVSARPRETTGTQLNADIVPGAGKFVERDLLPGLVKAGEELVAVENGVRAVWAPDRISQASRAEAAVIRSNLALRRQRTVKAQRAMKALERAWDTAPRSLQLEFAMAVDEGRYDDLEQHALTVTTGPLFRRQRAAQTLRTMAAMFKRLNDLKRAEANALGGRVGRIVHYYPREWVRPGKVRALVERMLYSRKPLQGRAGFKKARTRDKTTGEPFTFKQLYDAGFRPVEYNPVRAHLRKWLEMDKWIAARRILLEGKAARTTKFVRIGETPPPGWHRYDESFGTVYAPPIITIQESYDERLMSELVAFAQNLGIKLARKPNIGKGPSVWGYAQSPGFALEGTGPRERTPGVSPGNVVTKFAGAEEVLTHEIGHILDATYGLYERMVEPAGRETVTLKRGKRKGQTVTRTRKQDKATVARRTRVKEQLRKLADMRYEGVDPKKIPQGYKDYVREKSEQMANVVHAYVHIPERMKDVAPDAYWALFNTIKDHPELSGLNEVQKARGVRLGAAEADVRVNGLVIAGYYYGPPEAVRLLDNHLSPGLGGNKALNLYRFLGNLLNQVQLGLSGFHLVGTALNSAISKGALALEHASRGQFADAARRAIEVPVSPLVDIIRGHRALKHYYEHDANFRDILDSTSLVVRGGGGVGWDTFWHSSAPERFMQALHATAAEAKEGNYPGAVLRAALAAWRAFPALVELQAKPVMEWWVPRLKLAAYLDLARLELRDLGEAPDELELRKVLGDAWDSVDNRFGELVYDNLFWHRILKDAGMASVRALGWNVGTVREVAGAPLAQVRALLKPEPRVRQTGERLEPLTGERIPTYTVGREPWLTHKGAYFLALVFLSAVFGALYQKFHTGLNPGELEDGDYDTGTALFDLWFPRTGGTTSDGRPERASLPTYVKDVYAFGKHPWPTTIHKLHPLLSLMGQIWQNEDYYGNAIRDPEDPALRQALDLAKYMEGQYRPISVQSYFERQKNSKKGSAVKAVESFLGINVAPASVTRTPLEEYLHAVAPTFSKTKDQAERSATSRDVRNKLADKDIPSARQAAVEGHMTRRQALAAETAAQLSYVQRAFSHLSLKQGIHAYELASPHEREGLARLLERKADNADVPADEVDALRTRVVDALKLPRSTKKPRVESLLPGK